jgi:hypothetical protein
VRIGKKRVQKPMGTADWQVAQLRARELQAAAPEAYAAPLTIQEATDKFLKDAATSIGLREPTVRKYKLLFRSVPALLAYSFNFSSSL